MKRLITLALLLVAVCAPARAQQSRAELSIRRFDAATRERAVTLALVQFSSKLSVFAPLASDPVACGANYRGVAYFNTVSHVAKVCDGTSWLSFATGTGLTNSAGANVITKSNGTNLVASSLSDDGTNVLSTEPVAVGFGSTAPPTGPMLLAASTVSSSPRGIASMQFSSDTSGARVGFFKARGAIASPSTIVTGDTLGRLMFRGYVGATNAYVESASIEVVSTGTVADTSTGRLPSRLVFATSTDASPSVLTTALTIDESQNVTVAGLLKAGSSATTLTDSTGKILSAALNTVAAAQGGFGADVSAQSGVPLFAAGVPTFTSTSGSGNFARVTSSVFVTPTLGAALATSINGLTISTTTGTFTLTNAKTLSVSNTLTLAGTDGTTMTFPATSATVARTDAANTFTGHQTIEGVTSTGATGTNLLVFGTSPTIVTPTIASFANANHDHTNSAGGGQLNASSVFSAGTVPAARGGFGADFSGCSGIPVFSAGTPTCTAPTGTAGSAPVLGTSPTISTPRISQVIGGTAAGSALNLQATTSSSPSGETIVFKVGNNGATVVGTMTGAANFKLSGTATRGTTEGTNHLDIFDGTAPVGTLANGISLYSTSGELRTMDASGNATLLSPHDHTTNEWIFYSVNTQTGKVLRIDMERLMRDLDSRMGGGYVHESTDANALTTSSAKNTVTAAVAPLSNIGGTQLLTPTPGSTVTLTIDSTAKHIVASWTSGEAETINVSGTPQDGTVLTLIVTNDATLGRLMTAGTGLSALTTVLNVVSKKSTVSFVALNGTFYETSRTVGF
jgi:hypothetical protein